MKRLLIGLPFLLLALGPVACSDTAEEPILVPEPVEITLTPSDRLLFEPDGGTLTLTVDAKGANWKVEKSDAWINVAPDIAAGTVEVTVGPWDDLQPRSGRITVTGGAEPVSVEVVQNGVVPQLTADRTELDFGSGKESRTIAVTAVYVEWQAVAPEGGWFEVTADQAAGTILVTVQENPDTAPRSGSFDITGEGVDAITVTLSQQAGETVLFQDRSIAYRMGYRGPVRTVSRHLDFVNGPTTDLVSFEDLQFDARGNLLSFVRDYGSMAVTVEYDASDRITAIRAKSSELDFALLFEYGSHGKYTPIFELFESYLEATGYYPIDFRSWMPLLMKDLTAIKVRDAAMPDNNLAYRYTISGDEGSLDTDYEVEGYDLEPLFTMNFAGAYPSILYYEGEESSTYGIDPATGLTSRYLYYSYYDILMEHNIDRLNTVSHSVLGVLERTYTYNDNCDVVSRTVTSEPEYNLTASYTYDEQGNWIVMKHTVGPESGTAERIISYWK